MCPPKDQVESQFKKIIILILLANFSIQPQQGNGCYTFLPPWTTKKLDRPLEAAMRGSPEISYAQVHEFMLSRVQFFPTPRTVGCQAPLSVGFPRQEYWSGLLFPFPGDLLNPGIEPKSPALQADSLPLSHHKRETNEVSSVTGWLFAWRYFPEVCREKGPKQSLEISLSWRGRGWSLVKLKWLQVTRQSTEKEGATPWRGTRNLHRVPLNLWVNSKVDVGR